MLSAICNKHRGLPIDWESIQKAQLAKGCATRWAADYAVSAETLGDVSHITFPKEMPMTQLQVIYVLVGCILMNAQQVILATFRKGFNVGLPMYAGLQVPVLVLRLKRFIRSPLATILRVALNATRSACFLASFPTIFVTVILNWGRTTP